MAFCLIVMALQIYLASLCLGKLSCKFALEIILCGKLSTILIPGSLSGTLLNFLVRRDLVEEDYQKRVNIVQQFLQLKAIPIDLRRQVLNYLQFQHRKNVSNSVLAMDLPRSLAIKVANAKYSSMLEKCALRGKPFANCKPAFFNSLATMLKTVHVMPGEEVARRNEIPRELYFIHIGSLCYVDMNDRVIGVVRNDVPDMAPIAGEIPFFLGISHVSTILAHNGTKLLQVSVLLPSTQKESKYSLSFDKQFMYADGDVQLLILTKETSIQLSTNFPEEYGVITANLLRSMDLDEDGEVDIFKHVFL